MARILIKNGRVWDGEKFIFADVLTENKVICKIEKNITDNADFVFDAKGKIVSAGLVDIHVHIKGISPDRFGADPQMISFPFGVTAINDGGGEFGDKCLLQSFAVKNTVFVCADINKNRADFSLTESLLQKFGEKAIGVKVYFDTHATDVKDTTPLKEICDYAKKKGLKVMVHCSNSPTSMVEIVNTLSAGDILTHIYHGGQNTCTQDDFEAFKIAKQKGVIMDCGFAGEVHTDFKNLSTAIENGFLPDTISTDITCLSAFVRGGRYGMTTCMSFAKTVGMSEEDIFRCVTSTPAKALGKENEWGYLKVGRNADITVLDYTNEPFDLTDKAGNRLHSKTGYRCVLTVADGQVVFRD